MAHCLGDGVERNEDRAREWFRLADAGGHLQASFASKDAAYKGEKYYLDAGSAIPAGGMRILVATEKGYETSRTIPLAAALIFVVAARILWEKWRMTPMAAI